MKVSNMRKDEKSELWEVVQDKTRVLINYSKAGRYAGGHSHNIETRHLILHGSIEARSVESGKEVVRVYKAGDIIVQHPNEPLLNKALEDSVVVEFRPRADSSQVTTTPYGPYEKIKEGAA